MTTPGPGARVFISYAHADAALHASMTTHLRGLQRRGLVSTWDDREILAGDDWEDTIDDRLNQADVVLLFVTAQFIASDYCHGRELKRALERAADPEDRAIVVPIILENCDWESLGFTTRQALPPGKGKGVSDWPSVADHHTAVIRALRQRLTRVVDADSPWSARLGRRLRDPLWWQGPAGVALVLGVLGLGAAATWAGQWHQRESAQIHQEVLITTELLRSGRYASAGARLQAPCRRWWVGREACDALAKMEAAALLDQPAALPRQLEAFSDRLRQLRQQQPDDPDLLYLGGALALRQSAAAGAEDAHRAAALADIDRALDLTQGRYPEAAFFLAHQLLVDGRHTEALALLDLALKHNPNAPHYLNARAYARAASGDLNGAERDYRVSIQDGGLLASHLDLAALLWRKGQLAQALGTLHDARKAFRPDASALTGRDALPWYYELAAPALGEPRDRPSEHGAAVVALGTDAEKRCMTELMLAATRHLLNTSLAAALTMPADCDSESARLAPLAVLQMLHQAGERLPRDRVTDLSITLTELAAR